MLNYELFHSGIKKMNLLKYSEKFQDHESIANYYEIIKNILNDKEYSKVVDFACTRGSGDFPSPVELLDIADYIKPDDDIKDEAIIKKKIQMRDKSIQPESESMQDANGFLEKVPALIGSIGDKFMIDSAPVMITFNDMAKKVFPGWKAAVKYVLDEFWFEEKESKYNLALQYVRRQGFYISLEEYNERKPFSIGKKKKW